MILEQLYLGCLSQASYLVADEKSGVACVVDPRRDIDIYVEMAEARGVRIEHVLLTHVHADFIAGHLELRERCGATIHLGARASAEFDFSPMRDGEKLSLGPDVDLLFLETPGHTPESVCIAVENEGTVHCVFSGDTLFCGEVGRPDLLVGLGLKAEDLAAMLYDSLHEKLATLPDETIVYPGHGAGSACGKNISKDSFCTLGQQRQLNWALQPMSKDEFVAKLTSDMPTAPAYFALDAKWNTEEREALPEVLKASVQPIPTTEFLSQSSQGAQVVDTRPASDFAAGHLRGSFFLGLSGQYASWAGSILDPATSILIIAAPGQEEEAVMRLGRIGFDGVAGYLDGDIDTLKQAGATIDEFERAAVDGKAADTFVDVREMGEQLDSPIEGSISLPLSKLARNSAELLEESAVPQDRPLTTVCASGYRSMIALSLLRRAGYENCNDLIGGAGALGTTV